MTTHHVLVSPKLSTPLPVLTVGSRLGNPQPRALSVFKQPNRPQGTNMRGGLAPRRLFLTAPACLHLPGETCPARPTPRRCLWGPFEPRNTLLGKHVPEINSILASSQEQEHSRAVSTVEGQTRPTRSLSGPAALGSQGESACRLRPAGVLQSSEGAMLMRPREEPASLPTRLPCSPGAYRLTR